MISADQKEYLDHFVAPASLPDDSPLHSFSQDEIVSCAHFCHLSGNQCNLDGLFDAPCNECSAWDIVKNAANQIGPFLMATMIPLDRPPEPRSKFDASSKPMIPISCYIDRICQYSEITPQSMICAFILARSLVESHPDLQVTSFNVHRLTLISMMVYAKYYDDKMDNNARWARIAGITTAEINALEIAFLNICHFELHTSLQSFHECVHELTLFSKLGMRMYSSTCENSHPSLRKRLFHKRRASRKLEKASEEEIGKEPCNAHRPAVIAFFQPRRHSRNSENSTPSPSSSTHPSPSNPSPSSSKHSFHFFSHFHLTPRRSRKSRTGSSHESADLESDGSSCVSNPSEVEHSCIAESSAESTCNI
eukprot:c45545_g1_i1.p1 GENE.c45545_g1_i1~~c45545_g1_i1.p1  ORF type:complete len:365 (+),score=29.68 c45545_g1_i1:103-1197(+)